MDAPQPLGRRARNRAARHDQLIAAASAIVAEEGLDAVTMQGVAERVDCAVGTIYTYFPSKSALMAALQTNAVQTLMHTYHRSAEGWDDALARDGVDEAVASLVRLMAFGQLFVSGPVLHPQEFEFLQLLLMARERVIAIEDAKASVPMALTLVAETVVLIDTAVSAGALASHADRPEDDSLARTLRWFGGLDGCLLVSNVSTEHVPDPGSFDARRLSQLLTEDLLLAWGAPRRTLDAAKDVLARLEDDGELLPAPGT